MGPLPHVKRVSANFPTKLPNAFPTFHVIGLSVGYGVCVFGLHYVCRSRRRRHRLDWNSIFATAFRQRHWAAPLNPFVFSA